MKIKLPVLPYKANALEPYISERTLDRHHKDHHQAYVTKLGSLVPGTPFANADLDSIVKKADGAILYNATQIWNHNFYFESISKRRDYKLNGMLIEAIKKGFGSLNGFKDAIIKSATSIFGSGWIWIVVNQRGQLEIVQEMDSESPLRKGMKPILAIDVCEHAYYPDYPNRRIDYVNSFLKLLNWKIIEKRYCQFFTK